MGGGVEPSLQPLHAFLGRSLVRMERDFSLILVEGFSVASALLQRAGQVVVVTGGHWRELDCALQIWDGVRWAVLRQEQVAHLEPAFPLVFIEPE